MILIFFFFNANSEELDRKYNVVPTRTSAAKDLVNETAFRVHGGENIS